MTSRVAVNHLLAGQAVDQVATGRCDVSDLAPQFWFVILQPKDLGPNRLAGEGHA
jgi:hypothetical protein